LLGFSLNYQWAASQFCNKYNCDDIELDSGWRRGIKQF